MLSIILTSVIAVGTSIPLYKKYEGTSKIKMTYLYLFKLLIFIMMVLVVLVNAFVLIFSNVESNTSAIMAASIISSFFVVNLCTENEQERIVYFKLIALITFYMITLSMVYKVYLVSPLCTQKNVWEFSSWSWLRQFSPGFMDFLKNPYMSIFPLFLNWGFSENMDSWREALYQYLRIMRNSIQSYITSLQEGCHMLNLVNRIEEHKAYQIAVSLFKKGVDPEIIKEVIQENLPNFSDEQLEAAKKEAASK